MNAKNRAEIENIENDLIEQMKALIRIRAELIVADDLLPVENLAIEDAIQGVVKAIANLGKGKISAAEKEVA